MGIENGTNKYGQPIERIRDGRAVADMRLADRTSGNIPDPTLADKVKCLLCGHYFVPYKLNYHTVSNDLKFCIRCYELHPTRHGDG